LGPLVAFTTFALDTVFFALWPFHVFATWILTAWLGLALLILARLLSVIRHR